MNLINRLQYLSLNKFAEVPFNIKKTFLYKQLDVPLYAYITNSYLHEKNIDEMRDHELFIPPWFACFYFLDR